MSFEDGGVLTSRGGLGSGIEPASTDRVTLDVVATLLVFTIQPSNSVNGQPLGTQPIVMALDPNGNVDLGFSDPVVITTAAPGEVSGAEVTPIAGGAAFTGLAYSATKD